MKTLSLLLFFLFNSILCSSQIRSIDEITGLVNEIENSVKLDSVVLNANDVYGHTFDGGGDYVLYDIEGQLVKIRSSIGTSYGRYTTITYLDNKIPLKFVEIEMNFKWKEDDSGWDYSELNRVFLKETYVTDYGNADTEVRTAGKRVVSSKDDDYCGLYERDPEIERAFKLFSSQ